MLSSGHIESGLVLLLSYLYNDLGWGGTHWFTRNLLNALGITSFAAGALAVTLQSKIPAALLPWLGMIAAVVGTTVHTQDMFDQQGDAAAGRDTLPLVIGDALTRWTIALAVTFWSWVVPWYWRSAGAGYSLPVALGMAISWRILTRRKMAEDKATYRIYNGWLAAIYALPLIASSEQFAQQGISRQ